MPRSGLEAWGWAPGAGQDPGWARLWPAAPSAWPPLLPISLLAFVQGSLREVRFGYCTVPVGHLYVFFGKISIQNLSHFKNQIIWTFFVSFFFFLLLSSMSSLYILNINPISVIWFANILFHFLGCLFLLCSAQFSHSVVSNCLWPHEPQHDRPPCPSPTPGACSNSCPLS